MRSGQRLDLMMYLQALPLLLRHPSILAMPLLAGVLDVLVSSVSPLMTDPLGGLGQSLFQFLVQLIYGFAFGIAIIQASHIWRNRGGRFDEAWDEGRHKGSGIFLAVLGFYFLLFAAGYIGSIVGALGGIILPIIAAFFLIYTVPAAAIGGMPGGAAISASARAARANLLGTFVLAIVFYALFYGVEIYLVRPFAYNLGVTGYDISNAVVHAIALAYLAFPFAKQYDDIAFRAFW